MMTTAFPGTKLSRVVVTLRIWKRFRKHNSVKKYNRVFVTAVVSETQKSSTTEKHLCIFIAKTRKSAGRKYNTESSRTCDAQQGSHVE